MTKLEKLQLRSRILEETMAECDEAVKVARQVMKAHVKLKISEEKVLNEIRQEIAELEAKKEFEIPRARKGGVFYSVYSDGEVKQFDEYFTDFHNMLYESGNYFLNEKAAEFMAKKIKLEYETFHWRQKNDPSGMRFKMESPNYNTWYHGRTKEYGADRNKFINGFTYTFTTEELSKEFINRFGKRLLEVY
jgi:hypothetical protein